MAITGKFVLNDADFAPLTLYGIGTFLAFSGDGENRNRSNKTGVPNNGPIPEGKYWIVDRPEGNWRNGLRSWAIDTQRTYWDGVPTDHSKWFALYRDDLGIDDTTWVHNVQRGSFRLHPGQLSLGCITLAHNSDFEAIRCALLKTEKMLVPCMRSLMAYGSIEVVTNANNRP
uniref:Tlde1 domain-containing protein n=1 Tax=feces metagenome TaxID=1861841 RepID=A0A7M2QP41_9ZZZZ